MIPIERIRAHIIRNCLLFIQLEGVLTLWNYHSGLRPSRSSLRLVRIVSNVEVEAALLSSKHVSFYPTVLAVMISSKHTLPLGYPFVTSHTNFLLMVVEATNRFCIGLVLSRDKHFEWIESALSETLR